MTILRVILPFVLIFSLLLVPASLATEGTAGSFEDLICEPHPEYDGSLVCYPPDACEDQLDQTDECVPPDECGQLDDGTLLCHDPSAAEKVPSGSDGTGGADAVAVDCQPHPDDPEHLDLCYPPEACEDQLYETPECTPPEDCQANGDGSFTCEIPTADGHDFEEDVPCKRHPDIPDAFLCHPPEFCEGKLYETPACTPPEECEQVDQDLFLCRMPADEVRGVEQLPDHAPRCEFTGNPNEVTCQPPAACDDGRSVALCEPPAHCVAGPEGTYTCELPQDHRLDPKVIEEAMRETPRAGPVGPCGFEACGFDDPLIEDDSSMKAARDGAHKALAKAARNLQSEVAELRLDWQAGIEDLRADYDQAKTDLRAQYYACREDGGSVADCGTQARAQLDEITDELLAQRDELRASLLDRAEQAKAGACDELARELDELRRLFDLSGAPVHEFAPPDALRLCHDLGA